MRTNKKASQAMKLAHSIKAKFSTFSAALKSAWAIVNSKIFKLIARFSRVDYLSNAEFSSEMKNFYTGYSDISFSDNEYVLTVQFGIENWMDSDWLNQYKNDLVNAVKNRANFFETNVEII